VEAGATIVILEAMKTEINVVTSVAGKVRALFCRPGRQVAAGDRLLVIEPAA
jgi:urea carboxylase